MKLGEATSREARSSLAARGYAVIEGLLDERDLSHLRCECDALVARREACESCVFEVCRDSHPAETSDLDRRSFLERRGAAPLHSGARDVLVGLADAMKYELKLFNGRCVYFNEQVRSCSTTTHTPMTPSPR